MENPEIKRLNKPISKKEFAIHYMNMSESVFRNIINRDPIYSRLKKQFNYNKFQKLIFPHQANYILKHYGILNETNEL